nr:TnpV protein [uncultured Anaerostipes sp.]
MTEQLKVNNAMEWTEKINCTKQQAEEIILKEMIYN